MEEVWKDIKGYEYYYQVSNLGNVRSLDRNITGWDGVCVKTRGKLLKNNCNNKGYYYVVLCIGAKSKNVLIHRLVAQSFIPNPDNKPCVNHIDNDPENNKENNLEWCTYKENMEHASKYGNLVKGVKKFNSKLTEKQVIDIRHKYSLKQGTHRSLAKNYGVSKRTIANIVNYATWKHI